MIRDGKLSGILNDVIIRVFNCGIGEYARYRSINKEMSFNKMKSKRDGLDPDSLEFRLLSIMIDDFEAKGFNS